MNHKFKELALKANLEYDVFLPDAWSGENKDLEKFAELIVRECLTVCKAVGMKEVKNANESYNEGRHMGAEVCHNQIKRHFGIENNER